VSKIKTITFTISSALALSVLLLPKTITVSAKEQTVDLTQKTYEFGEKSEYEISSSESTSSPEVMTRLGKFSLSGDISKTYTEDDFTAYEIADDTIFSIHFDYDESLKKAADTEWHLTDDSKKTVNKVELDNTIIRKEAMTMSDKVRTGIYISEDLLRECDEYLSKNDGSRSELIESALRLYLATRKIKDKSEVLVPELAECISAASDEGITKISKGLFRYAVEVEMLIALLAETFEVSKNHLKDVRREAVNNVRRTRGKINLDDLIMRNEREGIVDNDDSPIQGNK